MVVKGQQRRRFGHGRKDRFQPGAVAFREIAQHMAVDPVLVTGMTDADTDTTEVRSNMAGEGAEIPDLAPQMTEELSIVVHPVAVRDVVDIPSTAAGADAARLLTAIGLAQYPRK